MALARTSLEGGGLSRDRVLRTCRRGLDSVSLRTALRADLRRLVAFDAYCVNRVDPASGAIAGSVGDGLPPDRAARLFAIEHGHDDVNKLADLATRAPYAAILGQATAGRPERSARMREVFLPIGLGHELRAALSVDGTCWGFLHLLRRTGEPDFSAADADRVRSVLEPIASALRASHLAVAAGAEPRSDGDRVRARAPAVLTLGADGQIDKMSALAERWLAELSDEIHLPLPHAVLSLAAHVAALPPEAAPAASCRVRARGGAWLEVHGSRMGDGVAIVIDRARSAEIAPYRLLAYRLTAREREVAALVARGAPNDGIAAALRLSTYTVKDHVKSILAKCGARSRGELAALLLGADE